MQERHLNRETYFNELSQTAREYYLDYIRQVREIRPGDRILEVGCGEGGNLLPFAELGCRVTGIDRLEERVGQAAAFFAKHGCEGRFVAADFMGYVPMEGERYELVLIHDVIEHIADKDGFVERLLPLLAPQALVFWGFPAWQMPFGGHQQMCHSKFCSHAPFLHLLPVPVYRSVLKAFHERPGCIGEMLDIKQCRTSIERFERLCKKHGLKVLHRQLWFVNPHYKQKFRLTPRKLWAPLAHLPWLRNFFSTSCFYLTAVEKRDQSEKPVAR